MNQTELKIKRRQRRKRGLRKRSFGVPAKPRLTVFRSCRNVYAQLIDDLSGRTLLSASTQEKTSKATNGGNCDAAKTVGKNLAERAKASGITTVVFDRNGYQYHGRIKALAEAAREGGLKF
jgi:large subunit ribosomal protein L18